MLNIAIYTLDMSMNGASKALLDMLNHLDYSEVQVDIYIGVLGGEFDNDFPSQVNIIHAPKYPKNLLKLFQCVLNHPVHFLKSLFQINRLTPNNPKHIYFEATSLRMPIIPKKYDIGIAFRHFNVDTFYIINNIRAKKKYFWVHGEAVFTEEEQKVLGKYYKKYDGVFPVSETAKNCLLSYFPNLKDKCTVLNNITDADKLKRLAKLGNGFQDSFNGLRILSLGRLSSEKGFIMAAEAAKILADKGYNFRWYIIGDGPEYKKIEKYIFDNSISDKMILLGKQMNPYAMLKNCDIFVSCSYTEAYPLTIMEAKTFERPILTTDIPAAHEQLIEQKNAIFSKTDSISIAKGLEKLLIDSSLRKEFTYNLSLEDHNDFKMIKILMAELKK